MKLILEDVADVQYLHEAREDGKKDVYITGRFLVADEVNKNKRFYPTSLLEREVARYTKEAIDQSRAYGELGHPAGPGINLDRVSHMIKSLHKEGNAWIGKAKLMDTPMGNIAKNLISEGAQLGVSSRGMGTLKPDNNLNADVVQDDYHLAVGADIVADPSAPGAFVRGIMENTEFYFDQAKGTWSERKIEPIIERLKKPSKDREGVALKMFESFLSGLKPIDLDEDVIKLGRARGLTLAESREKWKKAKIVADRINEDRDYAMKLYRHMLEG